VFQAIPCKEPHSCYPVAHTYISGCVTSRKFTSLRRQTRIIQQCQSRGGICYLAVPHEVPEYLAEARTESGAVNHGYGGCYSGEG
jgi:hypothetical protein